MSRQKRLNYCQTKPQSICLLCPKREAFIGFISILAFMLLFARYYYLQIIKGQHYQALSQKQHQQLLNFSGERGKIYTQDNYLLVGNHRIYRLYATASQVDTPEWLYYQLQPLILDDSQAAPTLKSATLFAQQMSEKKNTQGIVVLAQKISQKTKEKIDALNLSGLVFEAELVRFYPEASMAAHTIGFLSKDGSSGHYGIEGGLNKELEGKTSQALLDVDVYKNPIHLNSGLLQQNLDGRDIYLTIRRDLQILAEDALNQGMEKYGASRGEIIITDPKTGKILALATSPTYNPDQYPLFDANLYKNPAATDLFEPGSTFKILTVAAGIDSQVISPDTKCQKCQGPRKVADATIRTWNNVYYPQITMTQALEKSDNTAMVYITDLLGTDRFKNYLKKFGLGQPLNLEVQDDVKPNFPEVWGPVEVATRSFGQGISLSSLQLVRAVGAIANEGKMMRLYIVDQAYDKSSNQYYQTEPEVIEQVISASSAKTVSQMMQAAAQYGEAQYIYKSTNLIAGKTGTAQIPLQGKYSKDETIASFIGFAPYYDPQFLMLVKFERPKSSPWAAETAAVTWKEMAEKLFVIFNVH